MILKQDKHYKKSTEDSSADIMAKLGITTEGVEAAKQALGGELPDICQQTYDETMRKLNDWADETDS